MAGTRKGIMDKDEFERAQPPARLTRSKLDPFADQLFDLRRKGYVLRQLQEWLSGNKVKVQLETIRKFLNAREKFYETAAAKTEAVPVAKPGKPRAVGKEKVVAPTDTKITNPGEVRKARNREIDLDDYTDN